MGRALARGGAVGRVEPLCRAPRDGRPSPRALGRRGARVGSGARLQPLGARVAGASLRGLTGALAPPPVGALPCRTAVPVDAVARGGERSGRGAAAPSSCPVPLAGAAPRSVLVLS